MKSKFFLLSLLGSAFFYAECKAAPQPLTFKDEYSLQQAAKTVGEFRYKPGMDAKKWQKEARKDLVQKLGIEAKLKAPRVPLAPKILWQRKVKKGTITKLLL